jgi:hypothetical protein
VEGCSTLRAAVLDLEAATFCFSSKVSFCQCLNTCATLPEECVDDQGNLSERGGIVRNLTELGVPCSAARPEGPRVEASTEMLQIVPESEGHHLEESPQVTSPGSDIPLHLQKCLHDRRQMSFQGLGRLSGRSIP